MPTNFVSVFNIIMVVRQFSFSKLGKCMFFDTYKIRNAIEIC